jgi:hypothetical protein
MDESELEKEFEKTFKEIEPLIQAKIAAAVVLLNEAEGLSYQYGIPFRPKEEIMFCSPSYLPESMKEKWPDLDEDFVRELTGAFGYDGWDGWQQSQVC